MLNKEHKLFSTTHKKIFSQFIEKGIKIHHLILIKTYIAWLELRIHIQDRLSIIKHSVTTFCHLLNIFVNFKQKLSNLILVFP